MCHTQQGRSRYELGEITRMFPLQPIGSRCATKIISEAKKPMALFTLKEKNHKWAAPEKAKNLADRSYIKPPKEPSEIRTACTPACIRTALPTTCGASGEHLDKWDQGVLHPAHFPPTRQWQLSNLQKQINEKVQCANARWQSARPVHKLICSVTCRMIHATA